MTSVEDRFDAEVIAALLAQFDVTRVEDPAGASEFCDALQKRLDEDTIDQDESERAHMQADVWFIQGMLSYTRGDLDGTIELLELSIDCSQRVGYTRRHILGLRSIALCYENAGRQDDSTVHIFDALDRAHALGDDHTLALVSHTLTSLYQSQGAWDQMHESALRTCEFAERVNDQALLSRSYAAVGITLGYIRRPDEGLVWIDRAAALLVEGQQPITDQFIRINRLFLLRGARRSDEALELAIQLESAIAEVPAAEAARLAVLLAQVHLDADDLDRSQQMLERAEQIGQDVQLTSHLIGYLSVAAKLYEAKGDYPRALETMRAYIKLEDELHGRTARARVIALERHFATEIATKTEEIQHLRTVELVTKNNQLSDLIHETDEILHVVVHDLRNPLAAAQLLGESLMIDLKDHIDDDALAQLDSIRSASVEMRETIDLLALQETPTAAPTSAPLSVSDAVRTAVSKAQERSAARGVVIEANISDVDLLVDAVLLRRSLDDVMEAAIAFGAAGSSLSVGCIPVEDGAVQITITSAIQFTEGRLGADGLYLARRLIQRMNGSIVLSASSEDPPHTATIRLRG